ncbi:MAG: hypothetical protein E6J04_01820 [Chloroflexi bacterium]|nr:MAG: hypothetical protein E6J04_01820 [Chloroflexota bacterium]TMD50318.1 MAG: hypothetical protein E6I90_00320 [Chloroflexota bacterium]
MSSPWIILSVRAVFSVVVRAEVQDRVVVANQGKTAAVVVGILLAVHKDLVMAVLAFQVCMGMGWLEMVYLVVFEVEAMPSPEKNQKDRKLLEECLLAASQVRIK